MRHIFKVLESLLRRERQRTNASSISTARLAQIVQAAASMGKARSTEQDWLPYQIETEDGRPRIAADVAMTIRTLFQQRELPMPIMAFLMEDLKNADTLS